MIKKWLNKIFTFLISPFFIGLIITFLLIRIAITFYDTTPDVRRHLPIISTLSHWHQWSIDLRMVNRGHRSGSNRVAVLAVDERAVEQEGRWPWPREKIAKIISEVITNGAKLIAFDIIFSENDENSAFTALHRIKKNPLSTPIEALINEELSKANSDPILGAIIEKFNDHLIMGAYFDQLEVFVKPYQEYCLAQIYEKNLTYQNWDKEEYKVISLDSELPELPAFFSELFEIHFKKIREQTIQFYCKNESHCPQSLTLKEKNLLDQKIEEEKKKYCARWLDAGSKNNPPDELLSYIESNWDQIKQTSESLSSLTFNEGMNYLRERVLEHPIDMTGRWWMNIPLLTKGTKHTGYFNAFQDPDGSIRRTRLITRSGNELIASLALKTYMVDQGYLGAIATFEKDSKGKNVKIVKELNLTNSEGDPALKIPVNDQGELLINYAGPRYMFPHVSVADVLDPKKENLTITLRKSNAAKNSNNNNMEYTISKKDFFKDKLLIFGATATGIYDLRVTPFEENYPGVETHANVLDNLLRQDFLITHPDEPIYMLIFILLVGILFVFALNHLGAVAGLILTIVCLLSIYFIDKIFLFQKNIIVAIIFPIILIISNYILLTFYKYFTEERKKKELKGTFEKYVSPAIVAEVLADPSNIELGGRKAHLTVFFSDIRGFTTISEKLDPKALSDLLNLYLTPMTELVFSNKGTLDKYMGDAVMAFFGAPIFYPDHANHACRCALQSIEKLNELKKQFALKGLPLIDIGIGLNSGEMSVGNMGSQTVRNYTVMGDSVNLGSRLEGINKEYGTRIIISEFTKAQINNDFITREIDWVRVKGKALPVKIYELIAEKSTTQEISEMLKFFKQGFIEYHEKKWTQALHSFNQALIQFPADPVSKLYLKRCTEYSESPPNENWDGVYIMKSK